jgi:hypothetical protein
VRTPPWINEDDVEQAISRIGKRNRRLDDEDWGCIDQESASDVLQFVRRYAAHASRFVGNDPRRSAAQHDLQDAQVLQLWLEWEHRRAGLGLLEAMVNLGLPLTQIGSRLGITTGKGVQDRLDRERALFSDFRRPDASLARGVRRADQEVADPDSPKRAWIKANRAALASVTAKLLAYYKLADEEAADHLLDIKRDWQADTWGHGSIEVLGWAVDALRVSELVERLAPEHGVFRAIKAVDELRVAYANAGNTVTTTPGRQRGSGRGPCETSA